MISPKEGEQEVVNDVTVSPPEGVAANEDELKLEPPQPVPSVSTRQAGAQIRLDPETTRKISAAIDTYVDALFKLDPNSPEFDRKVRSISNMGRREIRQSAEASNRFLDRPVSEMQRGPMAPTSQVSNSLLALRKQIEELDPGRHFGKSRGIFNRVPFREKANSYFRRYQSAQSNIEAVVNGLYRGQDELLRDNAAIEQEKVHLWAIKGHLEQYVYMASLLDDAVSQKIDELQDTDPEKARALKEDVLFYVRQKRQDLLTQLSVNVQGYLALDIIRKNNIELLKGVERATTTTVSALRTAVISALAMSNQRIVLDQVTALNTTTGNIIESSSQMLRQQTSEIATQAASATVSIEKLEAAFNNVYATIETIDTFKLAALDSMQKTVDMLSREVARAQVYMDRARASEAGQSRADALSSELNLSPIREGP
ncbi:MAG: toxic anion resistance protein [Chloroflexi bacterium]|nr:toxic anion resistance protein [Chloroflexota bacterium]